MPPLLFAHCPEEKIHILKISSFNFLEEEEDKDTGGNAEDSKHDKGAPADVVQGQCQLRKTNAKIMSE